MFINKGNNSLVQVKCIVFVLCFFLLCVFVSLIVVATVGRKFQLKHLGGFHFMSFCSQCPSLGELLLSTLFTLCSCSRCFSLYELLFSMLLTLCSCCVLALGIPCFVCPCFKHSLLCELLLLSLFALCSVLGTPHSMCSCFGHSLLYVLLFLALPVALRAIHGSCIAFG